MTHWLDPQPVDTSSLAALNLHPLVARILVGRGLMTPEAARAFLAPDQLSQTQFPDIEKAVTRIAQALKEGEPICVWGDFDVDGQTATTLLVQLLQSLGAKVTYYIPIRGKEGHGFHIESLRPIIDNGVTLLVTCDTGITAHEAVDYARSRGVDVIITDHHDLGETLPNANVVINPKLLPEDHPLASLAGVGVAYKLAEALLIENRKFEINNLLDLVALGLVADVALLKGETRALVQKGIQTLRNTNRLGLKVMAELAEANLEVLTEETIGFTIAPRLNALGRLSDANPAVEFLLTADPVRARVLAAQIEGLNTQRRLLTSQVYEAAEAQLLENPSLLTEPVIILSHRDWPGGVVGIVANQLVERYRKPALLLTETEDGMLRGSARSIAGVHIRAAIASSKEQLIAFGGHPMAAGLSLKSDHLLQFRKSLNKSVEKMLGDAHIQEETLSVEDWIRFDDISMELADQIEQLAPFGAGNSLPVLATSGLTLESARELGRAKEHRRLVVIDEKQTRQEVLWWKGGGEELPMGKFDLAYSVRASTFRGERRITLVFKDFRIIEDKPIELRKQRPEILDLRSNLSDFKPRPSILIWAEGPDKSQGVDRFNLRESVEFAIWTIPPSPFELRAALKTVKPTTIYLLASAPEDEKPDDFLRRLTGMAKFAINQRGGKISVRAMASAMAQRETTIRLGFEWLVAGGHLVIEGDEDELQLSATHGNPNPYLQRELYVAIKGLVEETAAYRAHFVRAKAEQLMKY